MRKQRNLLCLVGATGPVEVVAVGDRYCDYAVEIVQQDKYVRIFDYYHKSDKLKPTYAPVEWPGKLQKVPSSEACQITDTCPKDQTTLICELCWLDVF